jgi:hypothetical protein
MPSVALVCAAVGRELTGDDILVAVMLLFGEPRSGRCGKSRRPFYTGEVQHVLVAFPEILAALPGTEPDQLPVIAGCNADFLSRTMNGNAAETA